jgi:hypothetical protein
LAVDQDRAGPALTLATTKFGAIESQLIAQCVKQRDVLIGVDRAAFAIDLQIHLSHVFVSIVLKGTQPDMPHLASKAQRSMQSN